MCKRPAFTTAALLAAFLIGGCAVSNPDSPYYTNTSLQQKTAFCHMLQTHSRHLQAYGGLHDKRRTL